MTAPLIGAPQYPAPLPLIPEAAAGAPYPLHALPPLLREAAEAIARHVQAPAALAGQCVIGAAAYLAQTRVNAPHLHHPEGMPCSLFLLTLGQSGDRKSECRRLAFRVIDDAERETRNNYRQQCSDIESEAVHLKGRARDEYMAKHPLPTDPRTQYSDATFEPIAGDFIRGMAAACWDTDEGGQLFGGASMKADTRAATLGGLVRAFDSGTFERTRSRGNVEGSGIAYNRRLSVHLLAQPIAVAEALADPLLQGQGFLARFLFADAPSLAGTRLLTIESMAASAYNDPRLHRFWDRCRAIMAAPGHIDPNNSEASPPVLALTTDAEAIWLAHYNDVEQQQGALGEFAGVRPFAGRAGEIARRLAAVLACFEQRDGIDADTMYQACAITRYSVGEWARYTEGERIHPDLKQAAALLEWLREKGWHDIHRDQLGNQGPTRNRAKLRDRLLAVLVEHHHLLTTDGKQFRINPALSAESADFAESQQPRDVESAETLRKGAEDSLPANRAAEKSALLRTPSAASSPETTGASAPSAHSARVPHETETLALFGGEI